ncbi:hypothetical protein CD932_17835 [Janthinobacterium sp. PC23-8]|nr:hypothetical protein CD932_17835 [Janthinobacterium sp. PC23-8]
MDADNTKRSRRQFVGVAASGTLASVVAPAMAQSSATCPAHGETSYEGSGRLAGRRASSSQPIIFGGEGLFLRV